MTTWTQTACDAAKLLGVDVSAFCDSGASTIGEGLTLQNAAEVEAAQLYAAVMSLIAQYKTASGTTATTFLTYINDYMKILDSYATQFPMSSTLKNYATQANAALSTALLAVSPNLIGLLEPTLGGRLNVTYTGAAGSGSGSSSSSSGTDMTAIYAEAAYIKDSILSLIKSYVASTGTTAASYLKQINDAILMLNYYGTSYPTDTTIAGYISAVKAALLAATPGTTITPPTVKTPMSTGVKVAIGVGVAGAAAFLISRII